MKTLIKILFGIILTALLPAVTSCSQKDTEEPESGEYAAVEGPQLRVQVGTVGSGASQGSDITEKIKSLRIIIISDGFIEYNQKVDFSEATREAGGFEYKLERGTVPGNKKFYLFANEESVAEVYFDKLQTLPDGITPGKSLTELLDNYTKEKLPAEGTLGYTNSGTGNEFERLINSTYFKSDLSIANDEIYLPYTSYYDGITADDDTEKTIGGTMYLVPVATKFTFNLKNYRQEGVRLHEIQIQSLNSYNYLMAALDDSELYKNYYGASFYWIDWLAKVAKDTQNANGSATSNNRSGWIEKYNLPTDPADEADYLVERVITARAGETWWAEALSNIDNPETIKITRYFPESLRMGKKNVYNNDTQESEEVDAQVYQVAFKVEEERESVIPVEPTQSDPMGLDNVTALFRGTHVVVNVDMYASTVEVYCMVEEWTYNSTPFIGYVQEDDDD